MPNEPSNSELQRLIERNHAEFLADYRGILDRLDRLVLREVYASDEQRRTARFEAIEGELKRTSSNRVLIATLIVTAFLGPLVTGLTVFLVTKGMK